MDGYSVQEAASVLGVPEGRVWELLARGVLSGTPEGDSMRVYLRALQGPMATAATRDEPVRGNGNGESHAPAGEASAFRELLTEFRNLTERYGQALLALGEARGEVAGLRSRVDLLEARLDLRLPASLESAPVAWESPAASPPAPEPPSPAGIEPVMPAPAPIRPTSRPRKVRSPRAAVAGFADALARAQDPTVADVGSSLAAAEAAPAEPEAAPAEAAPAEPEAAPATYSAAVVEPDWFADGDFAWLDAADMESRTQPEAITVPAAPAEPQPEPVAEAPGQFQPIVEAEMTPEPAPEPTAPQAPVEHVEGSTPAGEEEVMWLGADRDAASEMETAAPGRHAAPEPLPAAWDPWETDTWPAADSGSPEVETMRPPLAMTEEELARLALDEGWDDAEVAAIRAMISEPAPSAVELPGAVELDEAMAALNAVALEEDADLAPPREWAKPATSDDEPATHDDWAYESEPGPPPTPAAAPPGAPRREAVDPGWLRRRRGPAASAYRRLRRLFPG